MAESPTSPIVFLDRAAIFAANDRRTEVVHVPEWGGSIRVRSITGSERDRFEASMQSSKTGDTKLNLSNFRSKLIVLAACDEHGNALFGETDITALGKRSAAAIQRVFEVAQRLAGMTKADVDELTGEAETQSDSFGSD